MEDAKDNQEQKQLQQHESPVCPVAADGLSGSWKPRPEAEGARGGAASSQGSAGGERRTLPPGGMLLRLPPEENLQGGWAELPGARWDPGNDAYPRGGGCGPRAAVGHRGPGDEVKASALDRAAQTTTPVFVHPTAQRIRLGHRQSLTLLTFDPSVFQILIFITILPLYWILITEFRQNYPKIVKGAIKYSSPSGQVPPHQLFKDHRTLS